MMFGISPSNKSTGGPHLAFEMWGARVLPPDRSVLHIRSGLEILKLACRENGAQSCSFK
jgi:hypothetical protein